MYALGSTAYHPRIFWMKSLKEMWEDELEFQLSTREEIRKLSTTRQTTQILIHCEKLQNKIYRSASRSRSLDELIQFLAN